MSVASVAAGYPVAGSGPWRELLDLVSDALRQMRDSASDMNSVDAGLRPSRSTTGRVLPAPGLGEHPGSAGRPGASGPDEEQRDPGEDDDGIDDAPVLSGDGVGADHAEMWALVQAAQQGDGDAFGQLYDRYVDQVYRFIYYRVNDRALAEDFTSETFLRALRRIASINYQGRDIGAWFMTIARNIVFDHSKSARFRLEMSTGEDIESDERAPSPEMMVLANLTNERLLQAVNDLNDEQKECITLRFLHGLSVAETAEVMGKNEGAIKALQHRAVKRLATLIGDDLR